MIYSRTRVVTCQNRENGFGLRCGLTNQLYEMIQCVFLNLHFQNLVNSQKDDQVEGFGSKVVAMLEPNLCVSGSFTLCSCGHYLPFSKLFNFDKFSKLVGSKQVWQRITTQVNYSRIEDVFWTNQDKMENQFPRLDFPWHRLNRDFFLQLLQKRVELDGNSVNMITALEFGEMDCIRNELINDNSTRRELLTILIAENNSEKESMLQHLVTIVSKKCRYRVEEMERDDKLMSDINTKIEEAVNMDYYTFHSFEEASSSKFTFYNSIVKTQKDNDLSKVINLGRVYAWYNPILPPEFQLYSEMYLQLEPNKKMSATIDYFLEYLRKEAIKKKFHVDTTSNRTIVIHVQMPSEQETKMYFTCQRLPLMNNTFDWVNFLKNDVKVQKGDSIMVIGYGFQHFISTDEEKFPSQKVFDQLGAFLFTQTDIIGPTHIGNIYYNSLYAFFMSLKVDLFVSGVCGSQFGNHALFLRRMQHKRACIASHVDQSTFFRETPIAKYGYDEQLVQRQLNRTMEEVYHYPNFVYGVLFKASRCKYDHV
ncbi:hypothetical protein FDP41_005765 [Naegleria fowleri]|uniref:Uncharacterized protein n=1 Tax=Naegleria fowleri TaxID=5763 RepID=A0A6A5BJF5_NAEFO|nr:uncharacterized protein FDP41_005765 [Naegleria fowleri]KAF0975012.1 hypothetical protein FDP41_005765 [Naegleria fowleri]CAG4718953.1 unnamed protein product [Naegleria fowleri]